MSFISATDSGARAVSDLLLQLLTWVGARPRTYAETLDAWRTSCPRLPVWEEALDHGLVRVEPRSTASQSDTGVVLTEAGVRLLARSGG
jgi:hypothetical protein